MQQKNSQAAKKLIDRLVDDFEPPQEPRVSGKKNKKEKASKAEGEVKPKKSRARTVRNILNAEIADPESIKTIQEAFVEAREAAKHARRAADSAVFTAIEAEKAADKADQNAMKADAAAAHAWEIMDRFKVARLQKKKKENPLRIARDEPPVQARRPVNQIVNRRQRVQPQQPLQRPVQGPVQRPAQKGRPMSMEELDLYQALDDQAPDDRQRDAFPMPQDQLRHQVPRSQMQGHAPAHGQSLQSAQAQKQQAQVQAQIQAQRQAQQHQAQVRARIQAQNEQAQRYIQRKSVPEPRVPKKPSRAVPPRSPRNSRNAGPPKRLIAGE